MTPRIIPVDPFDLVVFGATGDLAQRKLLPALFHREQQGQIPPGARIIGTSRRTMSDAEFRAQAMAAIEAHVAKEDRPSDVCERFIDRLEYVAVDVAQKQGWMVLSKALKDGKSEDWSVLPREASEAFKPYASPHASHRVFDTKAFEVGEEERVQGKLGLLAQLNETLQRRAQHRANWNRFLAELFEGCADAPLRRGKEPHPINRRRSPCHQLSLNTTICPCDNKPS